MRAHSFCPARGTVVVRLDDLSGILFCWVSSVADEVLTLLSSAFVSLRLAVSSELASGGRNWRQKILHINYFQISDLNPTFINRRIIHLPVRT